MGSGQWAKDDASGAFSGRLGEEVEGARKCGKCKWKCGSEGLGRSE